MSGGVLKGVLVTVTAATMLGLCSCKSTTSHSQAERLAGAEKLRASLVAVGPHVVQVQMQSPGSFENQRSLPLSEDVRVYVGDKRVPLSQLRPGSALTIYRDARTRKVIRIEAD
jgi:hypothetical protein